MLNVRLHSHLMPTLSGWVGVTRTHLRCGNGPTRGTPGGEGEFYVNVRYALLLGKDSARRGQRRSRYTASGRHRVPRTRRWRRRAVHHVTSSTPAFLGMSTDLPQLLQMGTSGSGGE